MSSTRSRHSLVGTDRLRQYSVPQLWLESVGRNQVNGPTEERFQPFLYVEELEDADGDIEIHQDVHVAVIPRLAAGVRAEKNCAAGMNPYYRVFQYPRHYEFKYFVDEPKDAVRNGWGVVGGFLGIGLSPEVFVEEYSDWLRPYYLGKAGPPPGWKLVHTRPTAAYDGIPPVRILKLPPADGETDP